MKTTCLEVTDLFKGAFLLCMGGRLSYVENAPINAIDPWGLLSDKDKEEIRDRLVRIKQLRRNADNLKIYVFSRKGKEIGDEIRWHKNAIEELLAKDCPDKKNCELRCAAKGAAYIVYKVALHEAISVGVDAAKDMVIDKLVDIFKIGKNAIDVVNGVRGLSEKLDESISEVKLAGDIAKGVEAVMNNCLKKCRKNK